MNTMNKLLSPRFAGWILLMLLGGYFLFSLEVPQGESFVGALTSGDIRKAASFVRMPRIKLGIDLQGGTYLVMGVEIDKAIENKLKKSLKAVESVMDSQNLSKKPSKKSVDGNRIILQFRNSDDAKAALSFVKKEIKDLSSSLNNSDVILTLNPTDEQRFRSGVVEQAVNVLQNRLNGYGVSGLIVQSHGKRQIVVQMPGVDDPERVKSLITKSAMLEFKIVEKVAASENVLLDPFDGDLPFGKQIITDSRPDKGGQFFLVSTTADLTGDHISDARVAYDDLGRIQVGFTLDSDGATQFRRLTGNNIGRQLAIVIDNVVYSAPSINSEIGGQGSISGSFDAQEARDLALVLRSGSLLAPLKFEQESRVGASLGQDSIEKGILACLIGLLLVLLFSISYYGFLGLFAMFALIYNLFLILLFLSYFEATLTLPGIAGMVLTIGMAIDASILIYERIREEFSSGGSFRDALEKGFAGAMSVIIDSNVTTFLAGLVLFQFGAPAIKGFAITLMAGIIATIIAGVFFLRSLLRYAIDLRGSSGFKI